MRPKPLLLSLVLIACAAAHAQDDPYNRIKPLESAIESGNATVAQQLELADLYNRTGRYHEAGRIARRVLTSDPTNRQAIAIRDEAARGLRQANEARVRAAEAKANRGGATDADRLELANAYFDAGSYSAAADLYGRAPSGTLDREARLRHARALAWSGKMDDAERIYAQLLKEQRTPELQVEHGRLLSWMGASRAAIDTLKAAHDAAPTEESAIALANAHAWSGHRDEAIRLLSDYTEKNPNASEARLLLRDLQASPELRVDRIDRMIEREPFNLALRVEKVRLLVDAGRDSEALREIAFIRERAGDPIPELDALEKRARDHREQERARIAEELGRLDTTNVSNADQILSLAKAYTAIEDYDTAIRLYEEYLKLRPDDTQARIAYARVLSWDRRYSAAGRQYQKLIEQNPDRADLRLEYAQILSYDEQFFDAAQMFSSLTDLSDHPRAHLYGDVPPRAHYNLGQIYRWYGWNDHAVAQQNRALEIDSTFLPARQELDLIRHKQPATNYEARYSSSRDSNDFSLRRIDLSAEKWTSQRTAWSASLGRHEFEHFDTSVSALAASAGIAYRRTDRLLGRARLGANFYEEGFGARPFWGLGVQWLPNLQSRAALDYNHYDLIYDVFTLSSLKRTYGPGGLQFRDAITIDDFRAHYDYNSGGFWALLGDASYGLISDDNRRAAAHGIVSFRLLKEPFVALKADGRVLSYDFRTNRYWSPTDYSSLAGVLQVGQNIRDRFRWNAELKYGRSWENGFTSDLRVYSLNAAVPINDAIDIVGHVGYGKSGRLDSIFGNEGTDFVNYWQRNWYIGVRLKQLFARGDRRGETPWYFDNRSLVGSPVMPPLGSTP